MQILAIEPGNVIVIIEIYELPWVFVEDILNEVKRAELEACFEEQFKRLVF